MKTKPPSILKPFAMLFWLVISALPSAAEQFGDFTYEDTGTTITITGYPQDATGPVVIPGERSTESP